MIGNADRVLKYGLLRLGCEGASAKARARRREREGGNYKYEARVLKTCLSFEFLFLVVFLLCALPEIAHATPQIIRVDGSVFDNAGAPVTAAKDIQIKAYDAATAGTLLWTSSVYNTSVSSGRFTINLDAAAGSPSLVDRLGERTTSQAIYFQIEVDSGAANGSMDTPTIVLPRIRAKGTAFALNAASADVLKGVTATASEINYLAGATANVQTQINTLASGGSSASKVDKAGDSMSGTLEVGANLTSTGTVQAATLNSTSATASRFAMFDSSKNLVASANAVTDSEFGYLLGVTSALQAQLNAKQATIAYVPVSKLGDSMSGALQVGANITSTGTVAASTFNATGLTASRALVTDTSKNLASSSVTDTELGYLSGTTAAVQTQLVAKVLRSGDTMSGDLGLTGSQATPGRALILDSSSRVASSSVTAVELAYLAGVTAGIQAQLQKFLGQTCGAGQYLSGFDATGTKVCTALPNSSTSQSYTKVATALYFSCGILADQGIQCWGYNNNGQLGNGTATGSYVPVNVYRNDGTRLLASKVVVAGYYSACAIQASDSKVYCWGYNGYGQLGDGTTTASSIAVPVTSLGAVLDLAANGYSYSAVDSSGKVWGWGYNPNGELGDGTVTTSYTPVATISTLGAVTGMTNVVASGSGHSCAYNVANTTIYCWGYNNVGQLGDGTTTSASTAIQVDRTLMDSDGAVNVESMSAGGNSSSNSASTCAVTKVASLTGVSYATSIATSGNGTQWTNSSNATANDGAFATAALTSATVSVNLEATGFGFSIPSDATVSGIKVEWEKKVSAGSTAFDNTVRIIRGGTIGSTDKANASAWGTANNVFTAYGGGTDLWGETWTPADVNSSNFGTALSARSTSGTSRTYSVDSVRITVYYIPSSGANYKTYCWGQNNYGQLMNGNTTNQSTPVYASLIGVSSQPITVSMAFDSACFMPTVGGTVKCMGYNGYGQLGNGTTTDSTSAFVTVLPIGSATGSLSATYLGQAGGNQVQHYCAVTTSGAAACWGYNGYGQLGNGTTTDNSIPVGALH